MGDNADAKMLSADLVAALLAAHGITKAGNSQYEVMSSIDGSRTASSLEHQFRPIFQKAREIKKRLDVGEKFVAVTPGKKLAANADDGDTPTKPKKPRTTPAKPKATPKKAKMKSMLDSPEPDQTDRADEFAEASDERGQEFLTGLQDFIKQEKQEDQEDHDILEDYLA